MLMLVGVAPIIAAAAPAESEIEAPGPNGPLKGLMVPAVTPEAPVVLIVPDSGPVDRNGNSLHNLHTDTYRLLAQGFAARGLTSVRIDKRGLFSSHAAIANSNDATIADYAADIHAWAKAIREKTGARCIWVLGHGEGALVAMASAQRGPPDICGLVLVAAPGRKFGELLREQMRSNPNNAPILDEAERDIAQFEAGRRAAIDLDNTRPEITALFPPAVQGFLIDLLSYDPAALLARYKGPVLILQGGRDIQIGTDDARRLKAADDNARLVLLPDVNHVLKTVDSDDRRANLRTYFDAALPLAPGVVEAIADFIATAPKSP